MQLSDVICEDPDMRIGETDDYSRWGVLFVWPVRKPVIPVEIAEEAHGGWHWKTTQHDSGRLEVLEK
jgi:hypothetical protein